MKGKQLNLFDTNWALNNTLYDVFENDEFSELEYKSAAGGFPESFWDTYSAFANTDGGVIILGVSDKNGIVRIDGLDPKKVNGLKNFFWTNVNNTNKVSKSLLENKDVKELTVDDKTLLAFNVPPAARKDKPVFIGTNPFEGSYKRNHEGDFKCKDNEVKRMLSDSISIEQDNQILEYFTVDDIDWPSFNLFRQLFKNSKPTHPWHSKTDADLMTQIGGYRRDRHTRKEGYTLAGMLMFGKTQSIVDDACVPNFYPDYRLMGLKESDRWIDRVYPDGTWEANLMQFYWRVWPKLSSNLPKPFQLKNGQRLDENPTHVALREAFVNALIHADYNPLGNIIVVQNADGYVFTNPGTLLVTLDQYYQGGISECRNPNIQKMFILIGGAEKAGSGVSKIFAGWDFAHWRNPYLRREFQPDRVTLQLPMLSTIPDETLEYLRVLFGDSIDTLGKDEMTILSTCQIEGEISNTRLQYMISQHRSDITRILQDLCKDGFLIAEQKRRWTTYHLNQEFQQTLKPNLETLEPNLGTLEAEPLEQRRMPKKMSKLERDNIIVAICTNHFRTADFIAKYLERSTEYIRNEVLPPMTLQGLLIMKFPNIPNHPNQEYTAKIKA